ncbi:MAG: BLUF domain-containing protein [Eudoraea sp.]|uniref:BLUF domain-containing protein n=1 Tax=Eudoraea sp. TaxID=1979955 RepID=UPI003C72C6FC
MFSLVYRSTASPIFNKVDVKEMLEKARVNNLRDRITGCLLYYEGEFIQYLEGNQVMVLTLFDKIKVDKRHKDVTILAYGVTDSREFKDWEMAYADFFGDNDKMNYFKLLISSYNENLDSITSQNPSFNTFWIAVRENLDQTLESQP